MKTSISFARLLILASLLAPSVGFHSQIRVIKPMAMKISSITQSQLQPELNIDLRGVQLSTLQGKAFQPKDFPTLAEIKAKLPSETFQKDTFKSLSYAALDVVATGSTAFAGIKYVLPYAATLFSSPMPWDKVLAAIIWALYSIVVGSCGIGAWVTAHECGHGAFSDNKKLQDFIGYVFHSLLLVPYFSWQRSHAVHHANTNNIIDGETHVPHVKEDPSSYISRKVFLQKLFGEGVGEFVFGVSQIFLPLFLGWPAYLLFGLSGGPSRGYTNHFVPIQVPRSSQTEALKELFPGAWKMKMFFSDIGIVATLAGLLFLAKKFSLGWVLAAYGGPLLIVNAWLVGYTWLQHTDVDVPHLPAETFTYIKGAFHTIDRPYPKLLWGLLDFLHHHIGSTHGKFDG